MIDNNPRLQSTGKRLKSGLLSYQAESLGYLRRTMQFSRLFDDEALKRHERNRRVEAQAPFYITPGLSALHGGRVKARFAGRSFRTDGKNSGSV